MNQPKESSLRFSMRTMLIIVFIVAMIAAALGILHRSITSEGIITSRDEWYSIFEEFIEDSPLTEGEIHSIQYVQDGVS